MAYRLTQQLESGMAGKGITQTRHIDDEALGKTQADINAGMENEIIGIKAENESQQLAIDNAARLLDFNAVVNDGSNPGVYPFIRLQAGNYITEDGAEILNRHSLYIARTTCECGGVTYKEGSSYRVTSSVSEGVRTFTLVSIGGSVETDNLTIFERDNALCLGAPEGTAAGKTPVTGQGGVVTWQDSYVIYDKCDYTLDFSLHGETLSEIVMFRRRILDMTMWNVASLTVQIDGGAPITLIAPPGEGETPTSPTKKVIQCRDEGETATYSPALDSLGQLSSGTRLTWLISREVAGNAAAGVGYGETR